MAALRLEIDEELIEQIALRAAELLGMSVRTLRNKLNGTKADAVEA